MRGASGSTDPVAGTHRPAGSAAVRLDIQGLRAVAVLAVVLDHAGVGPFAGGYVGVDVFFVVSGFLITSLMLREVDRTGRVALLGFYARRARRILPAATVVLVAVLAWAATDLGYLATERISTDVGWAAVFLANLRFASTGTDYFAEGLPPSPVQHYWSLSVEEQFYLVWPPLLLVLLLVHRRWAASGTPGRRSGHRSATPLVAGVVAALVAASLAWSVHQTRTDGVTAYFSSLTRAWELGVGVLLALAAPLLARLGATARQVLALGGLAAVLAAVLLFDPTTPFPGHHALLPVLGTAAVLAAGTGSRAVGAARLLTVRPLTWVGDVSYSLYLWHWPVLVLWAASTGEERGPLETAGLLAAALALSAASYHLVENPVRRHRWLAGVRWRSLALWPAALGLVAVSVVGARVTVEERLAGRLDENQQYAALRGEESSVRAELTQALAMAREGSPVAFPLTDLDQLDALTEDRWHYRYRCNAAHDSDRARICPVGDASGDRLVVAFGDSHLGQWLPALDRLGRDAGYRLLPLVKFGCAPYDVELVTDGLTRPYTECSRFREWAIAEIERLDPDLVVLGGHALQANMAAAPEERLTAWATGVESTLGRLRPLADRVVVLGDVSRLPFDPIDCLTDDSATMRDCTGGEEPSIVEANRATAEAAERLGAEYVDAARWVCLRRHCPAFAGGLMVYGDPHHLTITWAEHVADLLAASLRLGPPAA